MYQIIINISLVLKQSHTHFNQRQKEMKANCFFLSCAKVSQTCSQHQDANFLMMASITFQGFVWLLLLFILKPEHSFKIYPEIFDKLNVL